MAVREDKERIYVTFTKKQVEWLRKWCKKHHITISEYLSYLCAKKAEEMLFYLRLMKSQEEAQEALQEAIRIAKTPWIKDDVFK